MSYITDHSVFILKQALVNNKSVLWANVVLNGITTCSFGFINAATIPTKSITYICSSIYQVFPVEDKLISASLDEANHGIIKEVQIGKAANRLVN